MATRKERTMIKRLMGCVREFKKPTILTLIFIVGESIIEPLIPFITAELVNKIDAAAYVLNYQSKAVFGFYATVEQAVENAAKYYTVVLKENAGVTSCGDRI